MYKRQIRLNGSALSSQEVDSGDVLQLQLNWQAERSPDADYTVFVQLLDAVSYTHLRAHETVLDLVCRLLLEKKQHPHTRERTSVE